MRTVALPAVVAVLALSVARCAGPVTGPSPRDTDTATTPYPNETVAFPDGPKSRPALPETLTVETASDYARLHEFRYSYNELWEGPGTEVGMSADGSCSVESAEPRADGYVVVVRCVGYVNSPVGGTDSTATQHADLPPWTVRYYVDENSVLRTEIE